MNVIGINTYFEHPAAVVLQDGKVSFAAEDERYTRIKHGRSYTPYATYAPIQACYHALRTTGLKLTDIDVIASSYSGRRHLRGLAGCFTGARPSSFYEELAAWFAYKNLRKSLTSRYAFPLYMRDCLTPEGFARIPFQERPHHDSHAASAFYCSDFERALVMVSDGAGERDSTTLYLGDTDGLKPIARFPIPHSLGFFYSGITEHIGYEPSSDEFKVMGLAPYGQPRYADILREVLCCQPQGRYTLDIKALRSLKTRIGKARMAIEPLTEFHMDIACSAQLVLEETIEHVVLYHLRKTGADTLCLAGDTFMNCVVNGRLSALNEIKAVYVQPAAHDAGTALGAAILVAGRPRVAMPNLALGSEYDDDEINATLDLAGISYTRINNADEHAEVLAEALAANRICALFRGRMEFGSRSLGQRSVLASPLTDAMRNRLNRAKVREDFRPVAPMVTQAAYDRYFDGPPNAYFMQFAVPVRNTAKASIPACVHVDGTARPQIVTLNQTFLDSLLKHFEARTGHPVLINTSFNSRGEPIVETPAQALACFYTSEIDLLSIGSFLIRKS
ncbi:MAG: hypothetical protein FWD67_12225 [Betaproteobacteria bacterium]|nr:hypothetical protein [Betaproteobacteria bacterium]